ncbi:AsmA family protein [Enterovibrio sp. ZSDZ42]|uniref:AsmA family protein n=1 Tax=Enterovibrio gelatinilyticus TaxID=2899819 RepID=A0ABT5R7E4_9GAMM|nr:AsmA family protein [Enterovibrio sp. ZSDZ42]MDD1796183.1 AsmA family protein [Enterovibrio sp. ZSDZ42]
MRLLIKLFASLLIVFVVTLATSLIVLSTNFGLPMLKQAVRLATPYQLNADSLEYSVLAPFSVALSGPNLEHDTDSDKNRSAEFISFRLAPFSSLLGEWVFASVVVRGVDLDKTVKHTWPSSLSIRHFALDDVSYHGDVLSFDHADIQLSDWQNSAETWGDWRGRFQLSTPKIKVEGQVLTNVLLDSEYRDDVWEIWGLSLNSGFGNITGSATLHPDNQWTVHQLTLSDARIEPSKQLQRLSKQWNTFRQHNNIHIKRIDLLDVSAALEQVTVEHLNFSAQSVHLKKGELVWAPNAASSLVSFNASLFNVEQWLLTDLLAELSLSPTRVDVSAFSAKVNDEGFVSFSGAMGASSLELKTLIANGLDIEIDTDTLHNLHQKWTAFDSVSVDQLSVKHTSIVLPDPDFPLQIIGLNLRGRDMVTRKKARDGMWQGTLTASAAAASINRIAVSAPYASMRVDEAGEWHLDPLSLNFPQGQLSAKAQIQLQSPSHPWAATINGLRIPNSLYQHWLGAPLPLLGEHDVEIQLSGLAADKNSFAYSLSGEVSATPYQTQLVTQPEQSLSQRLLTLFLPQKQSEPSVSIPVKVGEVKIIADRGRIALTPVSIEATAEAASLSGNWDLVTKEGALSNQTR